MKDNYENEIEERAEQMEESRRVLLQVGESMPCALLAALTHAGCVALRMSSSCPSDARRRRGKNSPSRKTTAAYSRKPMTFGTRWRACSERLPITIVSSTGVVRTCAVCIAGVSMLQKVANGVDHRFGAFGGGNSRSCRKGGASASNTLSTVHLLMTNFLLRF